MGNEGVTVGVVDGMVVVVLIGIFVGLIIKDVEPQKYQTVPSATTTARSIGSHGAELGESVSSFLSAIVDLLHCSALQEQRGNGAGVPAPMSTQVLPVITQHFAELR